MLPSHLVIQSSGSYEARSMLALAMKKDIRVTRCGAALLHNHQEALEKGAIPIGSVEFLNEAMRQVSVRPPKSLSYPKSLSQYLGREVKCLALHDVPADGDLFIQPAGTVKLFDGFLRSNTPAQDAAEEQFRREQFAKMSKLPGITPVYVCDPIRFESEWRVYVRRQRILGMARYDDGPDEAPTPSDYAIKQMIRHFKPDGAPVAYSVDVGVIESGKTVLVEINDAWALGLYRDMQDHEGYLAMLTDRWRQILKS